MLSKRHSILLELNLMMILFFDVSFSSFSSEFSSGIPKMLFSIVSIIVSSLSSFIFGKIYPSQFILYLEEFPVL